jgi:hypothetical protein
MSDPQTAATDASKRRTIIALIPFAIAVPAFIVVKALWEPSAAPRVLDNLFVVVAATLVVDLIVCAYVGIELLRTGEPPELNLEMSLSPLGPTREEREFRRRLRDRRTRNGVEFYDAFYSNRGVPPQLPGKLRESLELMIGLNLGALWPGDNLIAAEPELDWADVFYRMERDFDVTLPREAWGEFDGTFDSLVQMIIARGGEPASETLNDS